MADEVKKIEGQEGLIEQVKQAASALLAIFNEAADQVAEKNRKAEETAWRHNNGGPLPTDYAGQYLLASRLRDIAFRTNNASEAPVESLFTDFKNANGPTLYENGKPTEDFAVVLKYADKPESAVAEEAKKALGINNGIQNLEKDTRQKQEEIKKIIPEISLLEETRRQWGEQANAVEEMKKAEEKTQGGLDWLLRKDKKSKDQMEAIGSTQERLPELLEKLAQAEFKRHDLNATIKDLEAKLEPLENLERDLKPQLDEKFKERREMLGRIEEQEAKNPPDAAAMSALNEKKEVIGRDIDDAITKAVVAGKDTALLKENLLKPGEEMSDNEKKKKEDIEQRFSGYSQILTLKAGVDKDIQDETGLFKKAAAVGNFISQKNDAEARFKEDWGILTLTRSPVSMVTATNTRDNVSFKVVIAQDDNKRQTTVEIAADDPSLILKVTGQGKQITLAAPEGIQLNQNDLDVRKTIQNIRSGDEAFVFKDPVPVTTGINIDAPLKGSVVLEFRMANGAAMDLTQLETNASIQFNGGGRFMLSDKTGGDNFTLAVQESGAQGKPAILSIPSGTRLKPEDITLDDNKLSLNLQGKIDLPFYSINEKGGRDETLTDVYLEIREEGKKSRTMLVMQHGKFQYGSTADMLKKYEEEQTAIKAEVCGEHPLEALTKEYNQKTLAGEPLSNDKGNGLLPMVKRENTAAREV